MSLDQLTVAERLIESMFRHCVIDRLAKQRMIEKVTTLRAVGRAHAWDDVRSFIFGQGDDVMRYVSLHHDAVIREMTESVTPAPRRIWNTVTRGMVGTALTHEGFPGPETCKARKLLRQLKGELGRSGNGQDDTFIPEKLAPVLFPDKPDLQSVFLQTNWGLYTRRMET